MSDATMTAQPPAAPKTKEVARAIGWVTFLEIIRDKILYNILFCSVLLLGVAFLASRLAVLKQDRVVLDFGLSALSISGLAVAILVGSGMIGREFDRRTILVALSRPISRLQFVLGKYLGLAGVIALNWLLLTVAFFIILGLTVGGTVGGVLSGALFWALFFVLLQSLVAAALAVFFSVFTTTSLAVMFTLGLYLVGSNISQLRWLAARTPGAGATVLNVAAALFPNFEHFNLGLKVTYGLPVPFLFALTAILYAAAVIGACLLVGGLLLRRREA